MKINHLQSFPIQFPYNFSTQTSKQKNTSICKIRKKMLFLQKIVLRRIMASFKAVVFKHQMRNDATFGIKIRLTHNRKSKYINTDLVVTKIANSQSCVSHLKKASHRWEAKKNSINQKTLSSIGFHLTNLIFSTCVIKKFMLYYKYLYM